MRIRGLVCAGAGEAGWFTQLPWVMDQCREKLGFAPYPGTLNVEVAPEDLLAWDQLKARRGLAIEPLEASFCEASCHLVTVNGVVRAATIVPRVPDYPSGKLELLAPVHLMEALNLSFGEIIFIEPE
ncbi:MAG: CTP-dependent riboflavin kinase [Chloroflexi bacterium]|nr:CTP-dependent riboflavin kinase [Chloroflexota bacterium]